MKKVVLFLFLISSVYATEVTIGELVSLASKDSGKNIHIDKKLDTFSVDVNFYDYAAKGEMFSLLRDVLQRHNMTLSYNRSRNYYYVEKLPDLNRFPEEDPKKKIHFYTYKIRNVTNKDVADALSVMPDVKYKYLPQSNMIAYSATKEQHQFIKMSLYRTDNHVLQRPVKITIFSVEDHAIKQLGTQISKLGIKIDNAGLIGGSAYSLKNTVEFKAYISALESKGLSKIIQSPTLLLVNGVESEFKSVKTVPYLDVSATVTEARSTTTQQYSYKDVGLQVKILPFVKKHWIFLDLNLVSEEIIDLNDNKPITQKISYHNSVKIKNKHAVLLTGFKKVTRQDSGARVPVLSDIPVLGRLFDYTSHKNIIENINILIEVL